MPQPTPTQLVLIEVAGAAVLGGYAINRACFVAGIVVGVMALAGAVVPLHRRWLYQVQGSWLGLMRRRRAAAHRPGFAGLLGDYQVESVAGGRRGSNLGVIRSGTTWSLPLVLGLEGVFNDDAAVPVDLLAGLLRIEDVPLSSVRLITVTTPAHAMAQAPDGPAAPMTQLAARYCLLTLDTRRTAETIGARGGTQAAIHQILRRCAVHTEQVLATAGVTVRRLDENAAASLFATFMGPSSPASGRRGQQTAETWGDVRVGGTWSTVFAVTGSGADVTDRVLRLAAAAPTPVVTTSLMLQPTARSPHFEATMLVRISAPDLAPPQDAFRSLALLAQAYDLVMQRLDGEQGQLLRATTPLGVGESS
ncbi:MAG: type VII secretion protein EccE [Jatrophihabitans sp.]